MMTTRREFLKLAAAAPGVTAIGGVASLWQRPGPLLSAGQRIQAFCIDFNWVRGGFAPPGHWAAADPKAHVDWYAALGANVIQTFAVSCNGYGWYQKGRVPPQPGLQHNFLPEVVELAHQRGMLAMGYFCVGANSRWGASHPTLSYGTPSNVHIPFTDQYLDFLSQSLTDAMKKTGMDGTMLDWVWNPAEKLRTQGWLPAEQRLYTQLTGKTFPASGTPGAEDKLEYERKAIDRCWARIKAARDQANPRCVLWLSVNNLSQPSIKDSPMLRQVDWLMNESPDPNLYALGRHLAGAKTRMIQNEVGWPTHDARKFLSDPRHRDLDLYGFAEPEENSLPLPIEEYLRRPVEAFKPQERRSANNYNIAALARFYRGMPMEAVLP